MRTESRLPRVDKKEKEVVYLMESDGAVAQLGERLNGIQEVRGSNPLSSTYFLFGKKESKPRVWLFSI